VRDVGELTGRRVAVRAIDLAGNVSAPAGIDLHVARLRADQEAESAADARTGCAHSDANSGVWVMLGAALVLWRRRR
jgi:MYXO-CTERM domain-containing protein